MMVASVEDSCLLVAGATRYANRHRRRRRGAVVLAMILDHSVGRE
ncbi:hypothetical protein HU200_058419 [Digitaria exilis]|uniref:Uncharacterized protein n=1 Tax=Digitaria exilis TaxID=1010633 RepID=A0A835E3J9_9POAL|nr:hypothetical protein HU200_058419 [Digitaria exilis]